MTSDEADSKGGIQGAPAARGAARHTEGDNTGRVYCDCGCVPNVMSLHQMAALREQRKRERETKGKTERSTEGKE